MHKVIEYATIPKLKARIRGEVIYPDDLLSSRMRLCGKIKALVVSVRLMLTSLAVSL